MSTIQAVRELVWHTMHDADKRMDDSHPFHQKAVDLREKLWQIVYKLIEDERDLIGEMCDALAKGDPATAGSMGIIIDCCDEKLSDIARCAANNHINLN